MKEIIEARSTFLEAYYPELGVMQYRGTYYILGEVPMSPYINARSLNQQIESASPIMNLYAEIANSTRLGVGNMRISSKANYTEIHQLIINYPEFFTPKPGSALGAEHLAQYGGNTVDRRAHLVAIPLTMRLDSGWRSMVDSVIHTLATRDYPIEAVLADAQRVRGYMQNSGLRTPSTSTVRLADSWWGVNGRADSHIIPHSDHLHFFKKHKNAAEAIAHGNDCSTWPAIDSHHVMSALCVTDFEFNDRWQDDSGVVWISDMIYAGAVAISIRGSVEPSKVTARELRANFEKINADAIDDARRRNLGSERLRQLQSRFATMARTYEVGGPPVLHNATVTAIFNGIKDDETLLRHSAATLRTPEGFQHPAFRSTMLGSNVRLNFTSEEIPSHVIAYSGATSLNAPGDEDGVMIGFDELDLQPAYFDPKGAMMSDERPYSLIIGNTGSGKTMLGIKIALDTVKMGLPAHLNDLKAHTQGEGHSIVTEAAGGNVISLDDVQGDGGLDPIFVQNGSRFSIEVAHRMLMMINPFSTRASESEVPLLTALREGVENGGAKSIGQALKWSLDNGHLKGHEHIYEICTELHRSSAVFRLVYGVNPQGRPLSMDQGLTLIESGQVDLSLPDDPKPLDQMLMGDRMALAVVQMTVVASITAMSGRGGTVLIDEGWMFMAMDKAMMIKIGRLARSQRVSPILLTQRASDASELKDFISRVFVLSMSSEDEAREALKIMGEKDMSLVSRITAEARLPGSKPGEDRFNYRSLKALVTHDRKVVRGAVCLYKDLNQNITPVVVTIPEETLLLASTNEQDIIRRNKILEERAKDQGARSRMFSDLDELTIIDEGLAKRNAFEESSTTAGSREEVFDVSRRTGAVDKQPPTMTPEQAKAASYDALLG